MRTVVCGFRTVFASTKKTLFWVNLHCMYCVALKQLSECIDGMRHCSRTTLGGGDGGMSEHRQDVLIKRYQEIHFDYSTEFKNTSVSDM